LVCHYLFYLTRKKKNLTLSCFTNTRYCWEQILDWHCISSIINAIQAMTNKETNKVVFVTKKKKAVAESISPSAVEIYFLVRFKKWKLGQITSLTLVFFHFAPQKHACRHFIYSRLCGFCLLFNQQILKLVHQHCYTYTYTLVVSRSLCISSLAVAVCTVPSSCKAVVTRSNKPTSNQLT
jgi:hypothetical protein